MSTRQQPPRVEARPSSAHSMLDRLARPVFTFSSRANGTAEECHRARKESKYGLKRPPGAGWNNFRFADDSVTQRIAWKQVALLDLDQLVRQRDVRCLQRSLHETAYGRVTPSDLQVVADETIAKYIRLCQLTVQYLLHRNNAVDELVMKLGRVASAAQKAARRAENTGVAAERDKALMQLRRERQFTAFFKKVLRSKRVDVDAMEDALWEQLEGSKRAQSTTDANAQMGEHAAAYLSQKKKTVFSAISAALREQQNASATRIDGAADQILSRAEQIQRAHRAELERMHNTYEHDLADLSLQVRKQQLARVLRQRSAAQLRTAFRHWERETTAQTREEMLNQDHVLQKRLQDAEKAHRTAVQNMLQAQRNLAKELHATKTPQSPRHHPPSDSTFIPEPSQLVPHGNSTPGPDSTKSASNPSPERVGPPERVELEGIDAFLSRVERLHTAVNPPALEVVSFEDGTGEPQSPEGQVQKLALTRKRNKEKEQANAALQAIMDEYFVHSAKERGADVGEVDGFAAGPQRRMLELEAEVRRLESALQISPSDAYRAPAPIHHSDGEVNEGGKQQPGRGSAHVVDPSNSTPVNAVKAMRNSDGIGQLMSFPSLRSGASSDAEKVTPTPATADPSRTRNVRNVVAAAPKPATKDASISDTSEDSGLSATFRSAAMTPLMRNGLTPIGETGSIPDVDLLGRFEAQNVSDVSSGSAYRGHGGGRGSNGRPVVTPESSSSSSDHSGWSRLSSHSSIGELSLDKTTATTATMATAATAGSGDGRFRQVLRGILNGKVS